MTPCDSFGEIEFRGFGHGATISPVSVCVYLESYLCIDKLYLQATQTIFLSQFLDQMIICRRVSVVVHSASDREV